MQGEWKVLYYRLWNSVNLGPISEQDSALLDALHRKAFPEQYPCECYLKLDTAA